MFRLQTLSEVVSSTSFREAQITTELMIILEEEEVV